MKRKPTIFRLVKFFFVLIPRWELYYGDLEFDQRKFSNVKAMIGELNKLGFRTTFWVHPFLNNDSVNYAHVYDNTLGVRAEGSAFPSPTTWWNGDSAIVLDFTNLNAIDWFVDKLEALQDNYKIDTFKFDAGEFFSFCRLVDLLFYLLLKKFFMG